MKGIQRIRIRVRNERNEADERAYSSDKLLWSIGRYARIRELKFK
jgi:hypothetical protein